MKKVLSIMLCAVFLVLCLTGCVYEGVDVKLNQEGTGTVSMTVGFEKDFVDQMLGGQNPFEGKETSEIEYDGETYIAYTEVANYESFEDITKALLEMTYDTETLNVLGEEEAAYNTELQTPTEPEAELPIEPETDEETDSHGLTADDTVDFDTEYSDNHIFKSVEVKKEGSKYIFAAVLNAADGQIQGYDMSEIFKVSISVEMPGKVTAYKNGTVEGNKVTFDLSDLSEETEIYAESKVTSKIPAIIGIALAVIAVVVFIILKKKK